MNVYTTDKIRNVVLLGHGGAGKTSLFRILTTLSLPQGSERGEMLPARPRLSMHLLRGEELPEDRVGSRGYFCTTLSDNVVVPINRYFIAQQACG